MQEMITILNALIPISILVLSIIFITSVIFYFTKDEKKRYRAQTMRALLSLLVFVFLFQIFEIAVFAIDSIPVISSFIYLLIVIGALWWSVRDLIRTRTKMQVPDYFVTWPISKLQLIILSIIVLSAVAVFLIKLVNTSQTQALQNNTEENKTTESTTTKALQQAQRASLSNTLQDDNWGKIPTETNCDLLASTKEYKCINHSFGENNPFYTFYIPKESFDFDEDTLSDVWQRLIWQIEGRDYSILQPPGWVKNSAEDFTAINLFAKNAYGDKVHLATLAVQAYALDNPQQSLADFVNEYVKRFNLESDTQKVLGVEKGTLENGVERYNISGVSGVKNNPYVYLFVESLILDKEKNGVFSITTVMEQTISGHFWERLAGKINPII